MMAAAIGVSVPDSIIQLLIDGEYICPACLPRHESLTFGENCSHRQAQLEAALSMGLVTHWVDPKYTDDEPFFDHEPQYCPGCGVETLECAICGIYCNCNDVDGPICQGCFNNDDFPSVEVVLEAALARQPIVVHHLRYFYRTNPGSQLRLFDQTTIEPEVIKIGNHPGGWRSILDT